MKISKYKNIKSSELTMNLVQTKAENCSALPFHHAIFLYENIKRYMVAYLQESGANKNMKISKYKNINSSELNSTGEGRELQRTPLPSHNN
jgi:hypothetical protein